MGNQGKGTTTGVVYVIVRGKQIIPMVKIPTIGIVSIFDNETNQFVSGRVEWSMEKGAFVLV